MSCKNLRGKIDTLSNTTIPKILCTIQYILADLEEKNIDKVLVKKELDEIVALIVSDYKPLPLETEPIISFSDSMISIDDSIDSLLPNSDVNPPDYLELPSRNNESQAYEQPISHNLQPDTQKQSLTYFTLSSIQKIEQIRNIAKLSPEESVRGLNDEYLTELPSLVDDEILMLKANRVSALDTIEQILTEDIALPRKVEQQVQNVPINNKQLEPQDNDTPKDNKPPHESQQTPTKEVQESTPNSEGQQEFSGRYEQAQNDIQRLTPDTQQGTSQGCKSPGTMYSTPTEHRRDDNAQRYHRKHRSFLELSSYESDSPAYPLVVYDSDISSSSQSKLEQILKIPSKVPSKVASAVRKLFRFFPRTFGKKHELVVIKGPGEMADIYHSDEFIAPLRDYTVKREITQIEELSNEQEETVTQAEKAADCQKNTYTTIDADTWLDSDNEQIAAFRRDENTIISDIVVKTISSNDDSKWVLPVKQLSESHLKINETEDVKEKLANVVEFQSSYDHVYTNKILQNKYRNDNIEEECSSQATADEINNNFLKDIPNERFRIKAGEVDERSNIMKIDETPVSTDSDYYEESDTSSLTSEERAKRKLAKKKIKAIADANIENRPLRILDSDEILMKEREFKQQ